MSDRGSASYTTTSALRPSADPGDTEPLARPPARSGHDLAGGQTGADQLGGLVGDPAVPDRAAGIGADEDRAPLPRAGHARAGSGARAARASAPRTGGSGPAPAPRSPRTARSGGGSPSPGCPAPRCGRSASGVAPVACSRQSTPASSSASSASVANVCAVTRAPAACAPATAVASTSAGHRGVRSPSAPRSRSIQSATSLTQPSPRAASSSTAVGRSAGRAELAAVVPQVALGQGQVPPGADQPGQVCALVHPARVRRRARVAHQQDARVAVGERLQLGGRRVDRAVGGEPDVAVHVDEPGQHPAVEDGGRLGGRTLEA